MRLKRSGATKGTIQLHHIGEELVAAMLESLANEGKLDHVVCFRTKQSLAADICEGGLDAPINFHADDATLVVHHGNSAYSCDGAQTVDVLCTGGARAIAFEAKLGTERMGCAEFSRRFCDPCEKAGHKDSRLRGSMVAVLERTPPIDGSDLVAQVNNTKWTLAKPWWLVVRRCVLNKWKKARKFPVQKAARILDFDALAELYGLGQQFDELVQRIVGTGFAERWGIQLNDP